MQQQQQQQQQSALMSAPVGEVPVGSAMVCMPFQTRSKTYDRYKHKQSIGLGATQIIIAILCMIFNSVLLGMSSYNGMGFVGHGYWCGILFMITGIFGVLAGKKKTKCQIVTFMVLCIISAAFTIALLVVGIGGAISTRNYDYHIGCSGYGYGYYDDYYPYYRSPCFMANYGTIVAMESLLAICGLIEAIVAIWGSALCCRSGICCSSSPMMVVPSAGYFPHTGQMIFIGQTQEGQYVFAPQPTFSHDQDATAPPAYVQPGWAMPTTNIGPVLGQAPPEYMANQEQPLWMIPHSTTSQGLSAAQALLTDPAQNQKKESAEC